LIKIIFCLAKETLKEPTTPLKSPSRKKAKKSLYAESPADENSWNSTAKNDDSIWSPAAGNNILISRNFLKILINVICFSFEARFFKD